MYYTVVSVFDNRYYRMKQTEKLASAVYLLKKADLQSLFQDIIRGTKRLAYTDQEILDAPVTKLKDQLTLAEVGAGGDLLGGAAGAGAGYQLGRLSPGKGFAPTALRTLLRLIGTGTGGLAGTKLNDISQQEDLINKKLDLGYPQGLNLSLKKAGLEETDGTSYKLKSEAGKAVGMIGGAVLGNLLGRPLGGMFLNNLIRKGLLSHLGRQSRLRRSNHIFREANDPAFAQENARAINRLARESGAFLGTLPGGFGGGLLGYTATEKLASAAYLLKKADLQETLQDAIRKVKHTFNRPTDEQIWAGKDEAFKDLARKGENLFSGGEILSNVPRTAVPIFGLTAAGALGGTALGRGLGRGFAPQIERLLTKLTMNKIQRGIHYADQKFNKVFNPPIYEQDVKKILELGKSVGGLTGFTGGGIAGLLTGGSIAESIMKPKVIDKLREKGYPL